ncbi:MAG TPA: hypothetical protein VK979_10390 [Guyparkeria sp.]|nr:hypothetical protein [Guyparkeria sp.]
MPGSLQLVAVDDLRALFDRLAVAEPIQAAGLLADFLDRADLEEIGSADLAEAIASLEPRLEQTARTLRHSLRQSFLPITETARAQLDALFALYRAAQSLASLRLELAEASSDPEARMAEMMAAHRLRLEWAARLILDCYQLYVSVPQSLFADLHRFAQPARREASQPAAWDGVRDIYVGILLLAMVNPYALTVDEMAVLYPCLREIAGWVEITTERPPGSARFVDMTGQLAPHIAIRGGRAMAGSVVHVGVDALYGDDIAQRLEPECRMALRGFLRRLSFYLTPRETRRPKHHDSTAGGRSLVTIGFHSVHHRLRDKLPYSMGSSRHFSLLGLDEEEPRRPVHNELRRAPSIHDFKLELDSSTENEINWEARPGADSRHRGPRLHEPAVWDVVDLSEGGLRLHWRLDGNSRAAVDELILIERDSGAEVGGLPAVIGLGIIRWVRHLDVANRTIDMGVERLAGDWEAGLAHPVSEAYAGTWPVLARVDGDSIDRLILPPDLADRGGRLNVIQEQGNDIHLNLERIVMVGSHLVVMEAASDAH